MGQEDPPGLPKDGALRHHVEVFEEYVVEHSVDAVVAPSGLSPQAVTFLGRASSLLSQARVAAPADRLDLSYQAALRVAGAVLAANPGRRRKEDHSAWARVRRHAPEYSGWAARFEAFSRQWEDVRLGLARGVDELEARRV